MMRRSILGSMPFPGHGVEPHLKTLEDLEGLEIQMVSEQVDLTLRREDKTVLLDIDVTFSFKNHSDEDVSLGVAYPIGPKKNVRTFECETDGLIHDAKLKNRRENWTHEDNDQIREGSTVYGFTVWWYEWQSDFPAGETVMHKVRYTLALNGVGRTGYTVSSGGPWKGQIKKSVITLTVEDESVWSYLRTIGPLDQASESGDRLVWRYSEYDPTPKHDIFINYTNVPMQDEIQTLQNGEWSKRVHAVNLARKAHIAQGRLSLDEDGWRTYRAALANLVKDVEITDEAVTLPATDTVKVRKYTQFGRGEPGVEPEYEWVDKVVRRAYMPAGDPLLKSNLVRLRTLFNHLEGVALVAEMLPAEPETEALVKTWVKITEAHLEGKLFGGETKLQSEAGNRKQWKAKADELKKTLPSRVIQ